jgi:hypothetical protein
MDNRKTCLYPIIGVLSTQGFEIPSRKDTGTTLRRRCTADSCLRCGVQAVEPPAAQDDIAMTHEGNYWTRPSNILCPARSTRSSPGSGRGTADSCLRCGAGQLEAASAHGALRRLIPRGCCAKVAVRAWPWSCPAFTLEAAKRFFFKSNKQSFHTSQPLYRHCL